MEVWFFLQHTFIIIIIIIGLSLNDNHEDDGVIGYVLQREPRGCLVRASSQLVRQSQYQRVSTKSQSGSQQVTKTKQVQT